MTGDPSIIIPGLYLGNVFDSQDKDCLISLNIKSILPIGRGLMRYHKNDFIYIDNNLDIADGDFENILQFIPECIRFINEKLKIGNVLVHCGAGISRSSSIIIAYLMKTNNWKYNNALEFVQSKRALVQPNPGFEEQLQLYEEWNNTIVFNSINYQTFAEIKQKEKDDIFN